MRYFKIPTRALVIGFIALSIGIGVKAAIDGSLFHSGTMPNNKPILPAITFFLAGIAALYFTVRNWKDIK